MVSAWRTVLWLTRCSRCGGAGTRRRSWPLLSSQRVGPLNMGLADPSKAAQQVWIGCSSRWGARAPGTLAGWRGRQRAGAGSVASRRSLCRLFFDGALVGDVLDQPVKPVNKDVCGTYTINWGGECAAKRCEPIGGRHEPPVHHIKSHLVHLSTHAHRSGRTRRCARLLGPTAGSS